MSATTNNTNNKSTKIPQKGKEQEIVMARVRERQWIYLGPIMAAPLACIAATLYSSAKTVRAKQWIFDVGVVGSTVMTLGMRLYLMHHAGYPGGPGLQMAERERVVTPEEKKKIENPTIGTIVKEACVTIHDPTLCMIKRLTLAFRQLCYILMYS